MLLARLVEFLFALEDGVKPLDRGNRDLTGGVEGIRAQVLDVVLVGELVLGVGTVELLELFEGLPAQVGAIHEKEDALGPGVLDQPVTEVAGNKGLPGAGGHLDQGAGPVLRQRLLQIADGLDLRGPEGPRIELWYLAKVGPELLFA